MGFQYAGNLGGAGAPVVNKFLTNLDLYVGQLVNFTKAGTDALNLGGHLSVAVPAANANDDEFPIAGFVSGIVDGSRAYVAASSGTAQYGNKTTYTTTQSVVADTGPSEVKITLAIPGITLMQAPIFNAAWGTALTEQVVTTASGGGVTITAAGDAITDIIDDMATAYCRSGANRGLYRPVMTTTSTTVNTVTVPFPYGIAVGDVFVIASCLKGLGSMNFPTSADCIDGNHALAAFYSVYYHEINLEESGKEYAKFSLWTGQHLHA
jgi:hypothetical protein